MCQFRKRMDDSNPMAALLAQHQNDSTVLDEHFEKSNLKPEPSVSTSEDEAPIGLTFRQPSYSSLHDQLIMKGGKVVTDLEDAVEEDPIIVLDDKSDNADCAIGLTYRQPSFASLDGSSMVVKGGESLRDIKPVRTIPIEEVPEEGVDEDPEAALARELQNRNMERWRQIGYEPEPEPPRAAPPALEPIPPRPADEQPKVAGKHRRAGSDGMKLGEASASLARMHDALMLDRDDGDEVIEEEEEMAEEEEVHHSSLSSSNSSPVTPTASAEKVEVVKEEEEVHLSSVSSSNSSPVTPTASVEKVEVVKEEEEVHLSSVSSSNSSPVKPTASVEKVEVVKQEVVEEKKETQGPKRVSLMFEEPAPVVEERRKVVLKRESQVVGDVKPQPQPVARAQRWYRDEDPLDFFSRDEDEFQPRRVARQQSPGMSRMRGQYSGISGTRGQTSGISGTRGQPRAGARSTQRPATAGRGTTQRQSQQRQATTRLRPHPRQELGIRASKTAKPKPKAPEPKVTPKAKAKASREEIPEEEKKQTVVQDSASRTKTLEQLNVSIDDEPHELFGNLAKIVTEEKGSQIHQLLASGNTECIDPNDIDNIVQKVTEYRDTCIENLWVDETSYLNMVLGELSTFSKTLPEAQEGMSDLDIAKAKAQHSAEKYKKLIAHEKLKLKVAIQLLDDEYRAAAATLDQKYQSDELIQKYNKPSQQLLEMRQACKRLLKSEKIDDARRMTTRIQDQEKKEAKEMTSKLRHKYHDADRRLKERFAVRRELLERRSKCQIDLLEHHKKESHKKHKAHIAELDNPLLTVFADLEQTSEPPAPLNVRPPKPISRENDIRVIEVMTQEISRGRPAYEIDIDAAFRKSRR